MSKFLTARIAALSATVPFTGPETLERRNQQPFRARLGANESAFGPSPLARQAMQAALDEVWMYADPENYDLKQALARRHSCSPAHIAIAAGVDTLLGLLCRMVLEPGVNVVTSLGAYPTFAFHVTNAGAGLIRVPYSGNHEDPEALLQAARDRGARLLYLANPDNPMGSHHPGHVIRDLADRLPAGTLLVLDEAYAELAPDDAIPDIPADHPQVIRLRSFSKAWGLAGARVGYAIAAPELAQAFDRIRDHFGMGRVSLAGALASLQDDSWLPELRVKLAAARLRMAEIAGQNGLIPLPSATNFVTMDCQSDGDFARRVLAEAEKRGLFIRMPGVAPLDRCIRVSLGPPEMMDLVAEILPEALAAARG
ncbi:pyridoxal phosphate-dependent aminotransferase [Xinfangfangia sp. D13-10-4-6]|uniref:pyridoxal phosphate-dependent aminotransferase n=1 Tax=Pseudogemmobacter hezensis TaxID=2737662 RepID=UPI0015564E0F|nr:pyridoxal phosphate-dependent aminotransferase [Pseudogemmobacter hezensis]NPD13614.1 pyridoxal phosphate-dependent aminotransferase [Pseudogemmobacter hezensis]